MRLPFQMTTYSSHSSGETIKEKYSYLKLKDVFMYPFIPYVKITSDTYYHFTDKLAFVFSTYISYDFGMSYDVKHLNDIDHSYTYATPRIELTKYTYGSFGAGISIGFYFGRSKPI